MSKRKTRKEPKRQPQFDSRPAGWPKSKVLAIGIVVMAAVVWGWTRQGQPETKPNVFVIVLDTVRQDALGCYGRQAGPTPQLDSLASDGVRFDQAISSSGWTLPAIGSLMTGTWPTIHGAMGDHGTTLTPMRSETPTAAELFKEAGFGTVGFANAAFVSPMLGMNRGFERFDHRYSYNWDVRRADETIDAVISELHKRRDRSSFYFIHLFDAHLDYDPPGPLATRYTGGRNSPAPPLSMPKIKALGRGADAKEPPSDTDAAYVRSIYEGEIDFIDQHVGRLIHEIKVLGMYEQATIVVTSDHGEEFWDHDGFEHGHTLYDELILVPLIIKLPDSVKGTNPVVTPQVRVLDVMPTIFEIHSIDKPESFVGRSLLPLARGESSEDLIAFSESTLYGPPKISVRGPQYKYIEMLQKGAARGELYHWGNDPGETTDLSSQHPEIARRLRDQLHAHQQKNLFLSKSMSKLRPVDLDPKHIQQLRSLGYIR